MAIAEQASPRATRTALAATTHADGVPPGDRLHALNKRVRSGVVWVFAGRMLGIGATVLVTMLLARLLPLEDFGGFLLANTIMVFGSTLAVFGLNGAALRFIAEAFGAGEPHAARRAFNLCLVTALVSFVCVAGMIYIGLATFGSQLFREPRLLNLAPLIVANVVLCAGLQLIAEMLRGFHELRFASLLAGPAGGSLANLLFICMLSLSLFISPQTTLFQALATQTLAMVVALPCGLWCLSRTSRQGFAAAVPANNSSYALLTMPVLLRVCCPLMLTQLLMVVLLQADIWIAGTVFSKNDLALYGAARRMMVLVAVPLQVLTLTVMSSIPELYTQKRFRELERMLQTSATIAALPAFAALLPLVLMPGWSLRLFFGPFYTGAAAPLEVLAVGQLAFTWVGTANYTLALTGHQNAALAVNATGVVAFFGLGPLAASQLARQDSPSRQCRSPPLSPWLVGA